MQKKLTRKTFLCIPDKNCNQILEEKNKQAVCQKGENMAQSNNKINETCHVKDKNVISQVPQEKDNKTQKPADKK